MKNKEFLIMWSVCMAVLLAVLGMILILKPNIPMY